MLLESKSYYLWTIVLFICFGASVTFFTSNNLSQHVLQMPDDYVYPVATYDFLTTGQYHWAGAKPGIVVLSYLLGVPPTPYSFMFLYVVFSLLGCVALFLIGIIIFNNYFFAALASYAWMSSVFYFYYAKTHLLIFLAFYLWGIWLCYYGATKARWWIYYLGCSLLGMSVLTYYAVLSYLPVIFLFFLWLFYKRGHSFLSYVLKTSIPFLMPIAVLDGYALTTYLLWGKKNWPFLYSLYIQSKGLVHDIAANYGLFYYVGIFSRAEWLVVSITVLAGFFLLFYQCIVRQCEERLVLFSVLLVPGLLLSLRAYMGHLSGLRAFIAVLPFLYMAMMYPIFFITPVRWRLAVVNGLLFFLGFHFYDNAYKSDQSLKTGYMEAASYLNSPDFDLILFFGTRRLWQEFMPQKTVIPLNIADDPLLLFKDELLKKRLFDSIQQVLAANKKVVLVVSYTDSGSDTISFCYEQCKPYAIFLKKIMEFHNPHITADLVLEETNYTGAGAMKQIKKNMRPFIEVYELVGR